MIINGKSLLKAKPFEEMESEKIRFQGTSYGLSEAGYDIRIKQDVKIEKRLYSSGEFWNVYLDGCLVDTNTKFALASTIEEFQMPFNLVGKVHDKSTWARKRLSVFNTVIEPGWSGYLTLELVNHGPNSIHLRRGMGIAQVVFHLLDQPTAEPYPADGKYQHQEFGPVGPRS